MLRLIKLELQKLLLNRASKVLIFISFILPFTVLVLSSIKINFFGFFTLELGELGIFNFPIIWHLTTFFAAQFKFFFAIVVVSMISNEYSNRTLKQNLIDGLSKREFMASKVIVVAVFSALSTLFVAIISLILGMIYSDYTELSIVFQNYSFYYSIF